MSIPKELVLLIGALLIAGAVPAASGAVADVASVVELVPEQRTSHAMRRSGAASVAVRSGAGAVLPGSASVESRGSVVDPDTLRHTVRGGEIVIIDLPEELDGSSVYGYSIIRAPALSWLIDYSFMWRTVREDAGRHDVLVRAEGATDTLVVSITVE